MIRGASQDSCQPCEQTAAAATADHISDDLMTVPGLNINDFHHVEMDFADASWRRQIPAVPGWYAIETDAPLDALLRFPLPLEEGLHYQIANRAADAQYLIAQGAAIVPLELGDSYIVYMGEHGDLKARAREHTQGNKGTGCLSLAQYQLAAEYFWIFHYRPCEEHLPGSAGNKLLRNYLEQK